MSYRELFEAELAAHNITWCRGCDSYGSHTRGYAEIKARTIHYSKELATRRTFHGALHEIGHIVANTPSMRRWEAEQSAEVWASRRMRELGIAVPRVSVQRGRRYVARMKRWGNNISAGRKNK